MTTEEKIESLIEQETRLIADREAELKKKRDLEIEEEVIRVRLRGADVYIANLERRIREVRTRVVREQAAAAFGRRVAS